MNSKQSYLRECWSWVDKQLEELYYGYALTVENSDEYMAVGLLTENWAWVDNKLEAMCRAKDLRILCPAPISWVYYRDDDTTVPLEEKHRRRAESDISDYSDEVDRVMSRLIDNDSDYDPHYDEFYDCDGYDSF